MRSVASSVFLSGAVAASIEAHARRAAPDECCGLLLGDDDAIVEARPARNGAADPQRRYTIDPQDYFDSIRHARARGIRVIGAYHSHPVSEARPSPTDLAEAFEDFLFLIVGLRSKAAELRGWRLEHGNFVSVPLVRRP